MSCLYRFLLCLMPYRYLGRFGRGVGTLILEAERKSIPIQHLISTGPKRPGSLEFFRFGIDLCTCTSLFIRYNLSMAITRRQKEVIDFLSGFTSEERLLPVV